jgi:hypothetical protein
MASRDGAGAEPDKRVVLIDARHAEIRAALAQSLRSVGCATVSATGISHFVGRISEAQSAFFAARQAAGYAFG